MTRPLADLNHTTDYAHCNHWHEPTERHRVVNIGGEEFVANLDALPLLMALAGVGLRTRTHHIAQGDNHAFLSILIDPTVEVSVRQVREAKPRTTFNGQTELLIHWKPDFRWKADE